MSKGLLKIILLGMAALFSILLLTTEVDAFDVMKLDKVWVNYRYYHSSYRHPFFYDSKPKEELNLHVNTKFLNFGDGAHLFWNNQVHSMTNSAQYYLIGLQTELGAHFGPVELGYHHFSRHFLDRTYPYMKFPVQDAFFINLYFYRSEQ